MNILKAIATMEGFYVDGSRARRNNNPGNLQWGPFARLHGATALERIPAKYAGERPRFAYFPSPDKGFLALLLLLKSHIYEDLSVGEALRLYAPRNENDTAEYIKSICRWCGCTPDTALSSLTNDVSLAGGQP